MIQKHSNMVLWVCVLKTYHDMLPSKDDPETQQHGIEYTLSDVIQQQHIWDVESQCKPFYGTCVDTKMY